MPVSWSLRRPKPKAPEPVRPTAFGALSNLATKVKGYYDVAEGYSIPSTLLSVKAIRYEMPRLLRQLDVLKLHLKLLHELLEAARSDNTRCGLAGLVDAVDYAETSVVELFGGSLAPLMQGFTLLGPMWYVSTCAALSSELAMELALYNMTEGSTKRCKAVVLDKALAQHEEAQKALDSAIKNLKKIPALLQAKVRLRSGGLKEEEGVELA